MEQKIVDAIRALAGKNYDKGYGWQVIVECMDDEEILVEAGDTHDVKTAIRNIKAFVDIQSERYDEINNEKEYFGLYDD